MQIHSKYVIVCVFPIAGISTYIPSEGEHVVLSLQKSPNNIVSCSELHKATTPGRLQIVHTSIADKYIKNTLLLDQTQVYAVIIVRVVTYANIIEQLGHVYCMYAYVCRLIPEQLDIFTK